MTSIECCRFPLLDHNLSDHSGFVMPWYKASKINHAGFIESPNECSLLARLEREMLSNSVVAHLRHLAHHLGMLL